jgi:hypothetical protein
MKKLIFITCIGILLAAGGVTYAATVATTSQTIEAQTETGPSESRAGLPTPPEGQHEGPPPATAYTAPAATASILSDGVIAEIAREEAQEAGEEQPTISAVNTTLRQAVETNPASQVPANPSTEAMMQSRVVLVTMRGHFELKKARRPMGDKKIPTGDVLTLAIDAYTGHVDYREISEAPASGIAALGAARELP